VVAVSAALTSSKVSTIVKPQTLKPNNNRKNFDRYIKERLRTPRNRWVAVGTETYLRAVSTLVGAPLIWSGMEGPS
jgi:hypothetical protein